MMPRTQKVIGAYQQLETHAARMLALARTQDWDGLVREGEAYIAAASALSGMEYACELDERQRRSKYAALEKTLEYDLEIRTRLLEHREELSQSLARTRKQRALARAYGTVNTRGKPGPRGSKKRQP